MRVGNDIKRSKTLSSARTLSSEGMVLTGKATTAKKATLNNEKAKIFIDAASFAYNVAELSRLQNLIVEYSQVCNYIVMLAKYRGYYTTEDAKLAKHRTMTVVDGISLLVRL